MRFHWPWRCLVCSCAFILTGGFGTAVAACRQHQPRRVSPLLSIRQIRQLDPGVLSGRTARSRTRRSARLHQWGRRRRGPFVAGDDTLHSDRDRLISFASIAARSKAGGGRRAGEMIALVPTALTCRPIHRLMHGRQASERPSSLGRQREVDRVDIGLVPRAGRGNTSTPAVRECVSSQAATCRSMVRAISR